MDKYPRHLRRRRELVTEPRTTVGKHRTLFNKRGNLSIGTPVRSQVGAVGEIVGYRGATPMASFRERFGNPYEVEYLGRIDKRGYPTVRFVVLHDPMFASVA